MKKALLFAFVLLTFAACKKDKVSPAKTIVGNWRIDGSTINYYYQGKQVSSASDTENEQTNVAWQFDSSGSLKLAAYTNGTIDHSSEQSYTYQVKDDSLIVSTGGVTPVKLGLKFSDKNTMVLTQDTNYGSPQDFDGPPAFTADKSKTNITFKRL